MPETRTETKTRTETEAKIKQSAPAEAPKPKGEEQRPMKRMVQAPIGWPIQWFSLGMGSEEPRAAWCVGHMGPDSCSLLVFEDSGFRSILTCPHLSDPTLILHPEVPGVEPDGAWDYIPGLVPDKDKDVDALATRVVQLSLLHHWAPSQIAKATRIPEKVVNAMLASHAGQP